jgi:hypothetical protein
MSTFAELLAADTTGVVWLLEVTFNDFATIPYRWSTASFRDGSGNEFDGRISSIAPIERSFGRDRLPAATTCAMRIDNSDFAADWLVDRTTVASSLLRARFRLSACAYNASTYTSADSLNSATQSICVFTCLDLPEAVDNAVDITLADDSLGRLAEPLTTPTFRDWKTTQQVGVPFRYNPVPGMDWDVPLPLVLGLGEVGVQVPAYLAVSQFTNQVGPLYDAQDIFLRHLVVPTTYPIVVCVAKADNHLYRPPNSEVSKLYGTLRGDIQGKPEFSGVTLDIPKTFSAQINPLQVGQPVQHADLEVWHSRRSVTITKSGRDWQIVYIDLNVDAYAIWFHQSFDGVSVTPSGAQIPGYVGTHNSLPVAPAGAVAGSTSPQADRGAIMGAFASFACNGSPLSVVTTHLGGGAGFDASRNTVDFLSDVISYYSKASPSDVDTVAFARAAKARNGDQGAGIIQPFRPKPLTTMVQNGWASPNPRDGVVGVLRTALGEMCASADVDLFMTKSGAYSVATDVFDYTTLTTTRTSVDESRISRVRIKTPSSGERWAPYNRVMLVGPGGASFGPYDNQTAIDDWGTILPITLQAKWNAGLWGEDSADAASSVWNYRGLETKVRPVVKFLADRSYLSLELADYFELTITRGGQSTLFSNSIFRLERMRIDPTTLAVELEGVWADDIATDKPFLLDDENYLLVVESAGGRTVTVETGFDTASFSSGDLVADGVLEGDILVLKDSTQLDDDFTRNRSILIDSVTSATDIYFGDHSADTDFGGGPIAVAAWKIIRGATTYPTSVTDPTHYPNDGTMYGKTCTSLQRYSDNTAANKLLDG